MTVAVSGGDELLRSRNNVFYVKIRRYAEQRVKRMLRGLVRLQKVCGVVYEFQARDVIIKL